LVIGKNLTSKKLDREAQFRESQVHREHVYNWSSVGSTLSHKRRTVSSEWWHKTEDDVELAGF